jgi:hypothetical protein
MSIFSVIFILMLAFGALAADWFFNLKPGRGGREL